MELSDTSSGSTTTGPATFAEAFAADASSASTATPSPDLTASTSADATVPPVTEGTEGTTPAPGEPPKERWADILDNARTKAREEAEAQWQQYAWAKQVNQSDLHDAIRIAQLAKADPITYLQDFIKDLQSHPTYGAQLKSLAAKALSQRSQPSPQMVNVQLEDGTVVEMPRNPAEWLAAQKQQWLQEAEQKFSPFTKTVEQLQAERAELARQQSITQFVSTTEADVKTWPGMDDAENRKAVAEELARMTVTDDDPREVSLALNAAYRKVMLPKLQSRSESAVLENLQRKAAASTSVNPGSAAASAPSKVSSFHDKSLQWR